MRASDGMGRVSDNVRRKSSCLSGSLTPKSRLKGRLQVVRSTNRLHGLPRASELSEFSEMSAGSQWADGSRRAEGVAPAASDGVSAGSSAAASGEVRSVSQSAAVSPYLQRPIATASHAVHAATDGAAHAIHAASDVVHAVTPAVVAHGMGTASDAAVTAAAQLVWDGSNGASRVADAAATAAETVAVAVEAVVVEAAREEKVVMRTLRKQLSASVLGQPDEAFKHCGNASNSQFGFNDDD